MVAAALIGGATSLLSGIFGRKSAKKAAARERNQALEDDALRFVRTREAAEEAGFNPLTALQLGGTGLGGNMPSGGLAPLTAATFTQNTIEGVMSEISGEASLQRERDRLAVDLARVQLDNARAESAALASMSGGGGIGSLPSRVLAGQPQSNIGEEVHVSNVAGDNLRVLGLEIPMGDGSSAQQAEDQFGEAGGFAVGLANAFDSFGLARENWRSHNRALYGDAPFAVVEGGIADRAIDAVDDATSGFRAGMGQLWGNARNFWGF